MPIDNTTPVCEDCGWHVPDALRDVALTVPDYEAGLSAQTFLDTAHCCACGEAVTVDDLRALIDAFGDASTPPSVVDWWHAVWAYELVHADHHDAPQQQEQGT